MAITGSNFLSIWGAFNVRWLCCDRFAELHQPDAACPEAHMNTQPTFDFQWLSPLGISVVLFLLYGALNVVIGIGIPFLHNVGIARQLLIVSPRTDSIVFGQAPSQLLQNDLPLRKLRTILFQIMGGPYLAAGCLFLTITWFGLREGRAWAFTTLTGCSLAMLPFYYLALRPYFRPGVNLTLFDIPPFMWVPAVLLIPAVVLGWIGLA
jgi:hypothetical protein